MDGIDILGGRIVRVAQPEIRLASLSIIGAWRHAMMAGAALLVLPGLAVAQEVKVLEPITVEGEADGAAAEPGGVTVTSEELERRNPTNLHDVLRGEPGVAVSGVMPLIQKVYVQGLEDSNLNVTVDGGKTPPPAWHHLGTATIDPGMLKSVRIETGVAPADDGPAALGGSISYETKDGRDFVTGDNLFGGFGKLQYNTNAKGFTESGTVAAKKDGVDGLVYLMNTGGSNYTDGHGDTVRGTAPEMRSAMAKLAFSGTGGHRVEFSGSYTEDVGVRPSRPNFGNVLSQNNQRNMIEYYNHTIAASYKDETPSNMLDPELSLNFVKTQVTAYNVSLPGGAVSDLGSDIMSISGKAANTFAVQGGKVTAGFDFYHDEGTGTTYATGANGRPGRNREIVDNIGGFVQARMPVSDDFRVSVGGRGDNQWFEGIEGSKFSNFGLSGNANAEYDIAPWLMGYAGAGTTFGGIMMGETAIYNVTGIWNYAGLEPSRSRNYKAGFKVERDKLEASLNFFYNDINDRHSFIQVNRNTTNDVVTRGFSLSAKYHLDSGFVGSTFSRTIARIDGTVPQSNNSDGQSIQIGDMLTLEAEHRFDHLGIKIGTSNDFAFRNEDNSAHPLAGYAVFNVYGSWTPEQIQNLTLRIDGKNIFDQAYSNRTTTGYESANVDPFYDPGRTILLTAKIDF